jgi:hypothetical protein
MRPNFEILKRIEKFCPKILDQSPMERNQIVYIPRFLSQASLPKKLENISEWKRSINNHTYTLMSPSGIVIPGGAYSRLILIRINTLARLTKSQELDVGSNYAGFMNWMGLNQSGGKSGNVEVFKKHFIRCINCVIHTETVSVKTTEYSMTTVIDKAKIQSTEDWRWESKIRLSNAFFEESQTSAPTDLGALMCLSPGTLRMDIFTFLVSRLYYLKKETLIPWRQLAEMFASPAVSIRGFKQSFKLAFQEAEYFYPDANTHLNEWGLLLRPSRMLIEPIK